MLPIARFRTAGQACARIFDALADLEACDTDAIMPDAYTLANFFTDANDVVDYMIERVSLRGEHPGAEYLIRGMEGFVNICDLPEDLKADLNKHIAACIRKRIDRYTQGECYE